MSNATHEPRNPGDNKRRRNRGGRNRNQNRNHDDRENSGNRHQNGGQRHGGQGGNRHGRQDTRPPRTYSAPKLSWWQKLLKAIGLYKEPVRPPRPERPIEHPRPEGLEIRSPKNNTRNLRNGDGDGDSSAPREERPPRNREGRGDRDGRERRGDREPRGDRGDRGERAPRGDRRGGDPNSVESTRVYVGNLSYDVTEEDLKDLFKGVGPVRSIEIVYNRTTHRSKGYGFVEMLHVDEAKRAVEVLHDQPFMGRKLTVSGAKSRGQDEREDQEDRDARSQTPIQPVLAPLPAAAAAVAAAPIVETVTNLLDEPATAAPAVEIEPVVQIEKIEETQESSVDAQTVQDELPLVPTNTESCETGCGCSHTDEAPATETPTENS